MKYLKAVLFIIGIILLLFVSMEVILKELTRLQAIKQYWIFYLVSFSCILFSLYLIEKEGK
jgi:lipopolysaccharide export LptBFGC system permease protein LptF